MLGDSVIPIQAIHNAVLWTGRKSTHDKLYESTVIDWMNVVVH